MSVIKRNAMSLQTPQQTGKLWPWAPAQAELSQWAHRESGHHAGWTLSMGSTLTPMLPKTDTAQPICVQRGGTEADAEPLPQAVAGDKWVSQ